MRIIDSHFHWWPRSIFEALCRRKDYPRAEPNRSGGYNYLRRAGSGAHLNSWAEWFDLDKQLEHMDGLGHQVDVVCSIGPFSVSFSDMPAAEGRDLAMMWNEEMAGAQRKYPGRVWASAAVPLQDTRIAIDVLDHAITELGLMGVNMPGSVGGDPRIDAERLEPFYARVEELGLPHLPAPYRCGVPGDARWLWRSAPPQPWARDRGERCGIKAGALRHDGAASEPQDRHVPHRRRVALPVRPHGQEHDRSQAPATRQHVSETHVYRHRVAARHGHEIRDGLLWHRPRDVRHGLSLLGSATALRLIDEIGLTQEDRQKLFYSNARRILGLRDPVQPRSQTSVREPVPA